MAKSVDRGVARHLGPVDAADVFAPTDNLADESFRRGERVTDGVAAMRLCGSGRDFERREQLDVEGERQPRVK